MRKYHFSNFVCNGARLGEPIDFYDPDLKWQQVKLGRVKLTGGKAVFTVECRGFNEKAVPAKMFGLDYFLMKKL